MQKYVTFISNFLFYVTKYKSRTFYRIPTRYALPQFISLLNDTTNIMR